ncbi:MAG: WbqC family protein [Acidobacteria bacterium]|nr:WbqC family protein [Acidobacteriota bacterium]
MKVAIHQPNYLPWLGYFNKIQKCDVFVFLDNVQYSKNSYTNRTQILSNTGRMWLTQPVSLSGHFGCEIKDITIAVADWKEKHKKTIRQFYCKHKFFNDLALLIDYYDEVNSQNLAEVNISLIMKICEILKIERKFIISSKLSLSESCDATDRIVQIMKYLRGTVYLSGKGGMKYHDERLFKENGIVVEYLIWKDKPYQQYKRNSFEEGLSTIDAIANIGIAGVSQLLQVE